MKSYLLEAVAKHLDAKEQPSNEDRDYLRQLFVQHSFLLNAIESDKECDELVTQRINAFMEQQRFDLKLPQPEEQSSIIIP